jgi:lysophospholipase L1-like esterase
LVVRQSFERLRLLTDRVHVPVLVAALPIVERFDDPVCLAMYDQVLDVARAQGFDAVRVVDAFAGLKPEAFEKPGARVDITHPNADGHERIARRIGERVAPMLWPESATANVPGAPPPANVVR